MICAFTFQDIPTFVAFGPNGGWVALYGTDKVHSDGINWAGVPTGLSNLLYNKYTNGLYNSKRRLPRVTMLAFDETSFIICYSNGSYSTHGAGNEYDEDLFPLGKSHSPTFLAMNFKRDSYFADIGNEDYIDFTTYQYCLYYQYNLPIAMKKLIANKKKEGPFVSLAAMGKEEDSYFLSFTDGRTFWNNLPDKLEESLRQAKI